MIFGFLGLSEGTYPVQICIESSVYVNVPENLDAKISSSAGGGGRVDPKLLPNLSEDIEKAKQKERKKKEKRRTEGRTNRSKLRLLGLPSGLGF